MRVNRDQEEIKNIFRALCSFNRGEKNDKGQGEESRDAYAIFSTVSLSSSQLSAEFRNKNTENTRKSEVDFVGNSIQQQCRIVLKIKKSQSRVY